MRWGLLSAAVVLTSLAFAAPAQALLDPPDAAELANALAEARAEQDVCYGWDVSGDQLNVGSSDGPGVPVNPNTCERYVILQVTVDYACGSCESEDSASFAVLSNVPNPPTTSDLKNLGYDTGDLLGDKDDEALFNMTEALPLLTAEKGSVAFVPYEPATNVPATDKATNSPGSDFFRDHWLGLILFLVLVLAGPILFLYRRSQDRKTSKWKRNVDKARPVGRVVTAGGPARPGKKTWSPTPPPPAHGPPPPAASSPPPPVSPPPHQGPPPGAAPPTNDPNKE